MPRYKQRTYRRRPRKQTVTRKIARQEAKKVVNRTIESKIYDGVIAATGIDYTGQTFPMTANNQGVSAIAQGSGDANYIGSKITPTHLTIRGNWVCVDVQNMVRCIVVQVIGGGIPTTSTVLASVTNVRAPLSPLERDYDKTFRVLADRTWQLSTTDRIATAFKIKIGMKHLRPIWFNDAAGSVERGGLYLLVISDSAAASHPVIQVYHRMFFKDA